MGVGGLAEHWGPLGLGGECLSGLVCLGDSSLSKSQILTFAFIFMLWFSYSTVLAPGKRFKRASKKCSKTLSGLSKEGPRNGQGSAEKDAKYIIGPVEGPRVGVGAKFPYQPLPWKDALAPPPQKKEIKHSRATRPPGQPEPGKAISPKSSIFVAGWWRAS